MSKKPYNNSKRIVVISVALLSLAMLPLCTCSTKAVTQEFTITDLKKTKKSKIFDTIVNYSVTFNRDKNTSKNFYRENPNISQHVVSKLKNIEGFRSFELSLAIGGFYNLENSPIKEKLPSHGSFLTVDCSGDDLCYEQIAYILSGLFSFNAENTAHLGDRNYFVDENGKKIFFYSLGQEGYCTHQMFKINKFLNPMDNSITRSVFAKEIFEGRYISQVVKFSFFDTEKEFFAFDIALNAIIDSRLLRNLLGEPYYSLYGPIDLNYSRREEDSEFRAKKRIEFGTTFRDALDSLVEGQDIKKVTELPTTALRIDRRVLGELRMPEKTLLTRFQNFEKMSKKVKYTLPFDFHQRPWIETLAVNISETEDSLPFTFQYRERNHYPLKFYWPIQIYEIEFELPATSTVDLTIKYGFQLVSSQNRSPEEPRGFYLPGAIAEIKNGNSKKSEIVKIEPLLTNQKDLDDAILFTSLTFSVLGLTFLYTNIAFITAGSSSLKL